MRNFISITLLTLSLIACKDQDSIQTFFVEHQEQQNYSLVDISKTLFDFSKVTLTDSERRAYNSLDRLNVLMYKATDSTQFTYNKELKSIHRVFENPNYSELMQFNFDGMKFKISTIAGENMVSEVLVLISSNQIGFAAIRVLGRNMSPEKIVALIYKVKNVDMGGNKLKSIMSFFK